MTITSFQSSNRVARMAYPFAALCAAFALILVVRWEIVDSPPYFDFAIGIWREAEYLARTGFDYMALRYECSHGLSPRGGPRNYMTSIVPSALAVLFRTFSNPTIPIVIYHLAVMMAAAGAAVLLFRMLRPRVGAAVAATAAVAMTTTPVYCVQIDMVGFEIFLALAGLFWIWAVEQERFCLAAFLSFAAFLIKPSGMILTASLAGYLGIRLGLELVLQRRWSWQLARALTVQIAVLVAEQAILWWGDSVEFQFAGRLSLAMALAWFPDVLVLVFFSLLLLLIFTFRDLWATSKDCPSTDPSSSLASKRLDALQQSIRSQPMLWCAGFVVALLIVAISNVRFVPRYASMAVPFLYLILPIAAIAVVPRRRLVTTAFAFVTLINLVNWNGVLFPDRTWALEQLGGLPAEALAREGSVLERSHEYLANHRENLAATRAAFEQAQGRPIVTSVPFNMYLAFPEFGVVAKPANVYSILPIGGNRNISRIKELSELEQDEPPEIFCLRDTSTWFFALAAMEIPRPSSRDVVLFQDGPERLLTVYFRDFRPTGGQGWKQWLRLAKSFPFYTALRLYAAFKAGGAAAVSVEAHDRLLRQSAAGERMRTDPGPIAGNLWAIFAAAAARCGKADVALRALVEAEASDSLLSSIQPVMLRESAGGPLDDSLVAFLQGDRELSRRLALEYALAESPLLRRWIGEYAKGMLLWNAGDLTEAKAAFQRMLLYQKDFWPAQIGLARVLLQENQQSKALTVLERILQEQPSSESAVRLVALTLLSQGNVDGARRRLQEYLAGYPDAVKIRQCLEEIEARHTLAQ